jgi:small multidrug resistance family-3 protein
MSAILILKSVLAFLLRAVCEIGGGYLIWLWLREGGRPGTDCSGRPPAGAR